MVDLFLRHNATIAPAYTSAATHVMILFLVLYYDKLIEFDSMHVHTFILIFLLNNTIFLIS